jgi:hypothetical protein
LGLLFFQKRAQSIELRVPEFLVALEPRNGALQGAAFKLAADNAASFLSLDEPGVLQDAEMLHESGQRHAERLGQLSHGVLAPAKLRKDGASRRISKRAEDPVEPVG